MNINFFRIYLQKTLSSHYSMMREMTDILAGLDCSLFFIVSRVQSGWWLGVLVSPTASVGEMPLGLVLYILWALNKVNNSIFEHSIYTWKCMVFNAQSSFIERNWPILLSQNLQQKLVIVAKTTEQEREYQLGLQYQVCTEVYPAIGASCKLGRYLSGNRSVGSW